MKNRFCIVLSIIFLIFIASASGQQTSIDTVKNSNNLKFKYSSLILPGILLSYGFIGLDNDMLIYTDREVTDEVTENIDEKATIDDFSQYVSFLSVYGLNAIGIKGKNDFRTRTTVLVSAYIIMGSTVTTIKSIAKIRRPDGSTKNSFPSGHTATAFMGAEFLWQEYKNVSVWYGITGYTIAAGTGFFRIYNERHWLTDVAAGAGIGILSTKAAYWINPYLNRKLFRNKQTNQSSAIVYPFYNGHQLGAGLAICF
ncbi:MAG: phosphatase PAP2 family protein [Bacteroidales bacterium]